MTPQEILLKQQRDQLETMLREVSVYAPQNVKNDIFAFLESLNPPSPKQSLCLFVMGMMFTGLAIMAVC